MRTNRNFEYFGNEKKDWDSVYSKKLVEKLLNNDSSGLKEDGFVDIRDIVDYVFSEHVDLNYDKINEQISLKVFDIETWMCTDSMVGHYCYFLDDRFIGISFQPGRKSDVNYYWRSKTDVLNLKDFLKQFIIEPELEEYNCNLPGSYFCERNQ